jgi:signal transduction histidine kinase
MSMNGEPIASDQPAKPIPMSWRWRVFPIFWALVFCTGLALSTLALYYRHPEQLNGWSGIGLGVMLLANFGIFMLLAWGWLYRTPPMPARRGLIVFGVQIVLLLLLMRWYGPSFAWISLALLYPVIGGLPNRQWPLPVVLLVLIFGPGTLLADSTAEVSTASLLNAGLQVAVNIGIAVGLRLLSAQSDQLRIALEKLRQAHAELAASAAQKEELAVLRERTRLARAMHDNLGHALVVMNVKLEAAQLLYARDPARGEAELDATRALIRSTMAELRHALGDLRAPAAEHDDLAAALQRLVQATQVRTNIEITCDRVTR